jgi:hypothetical protein
MRIRIRKLVSKNGTLAGAVFGRNLLASMVQLAAQEPLAPEPLFLDFADIQLATASFLRETVIAMRELIRGRRSNFYPVVANASDLVREELVDLLKTVGGALIHCELSDDEHHSRPTIIGSLDPKQQLTLDLVQRLGEVDAGTLMRMHREEDVKQTAWNNRLAALVSMGLVIENQFGRAKKYRPVLEVN